MQPSPRSSSPLPSASSSGGKIDFEPNEEWKLTTWHELCARRKDIFISELVKLRTAGVKDPSLEQNILHGLEKLDTETYYEKVEQERRSRKMAWTENMVRQSTVAQSTSQEVPDISIPIDPPKSSSSGDNILPLSPDIQRTQLRYPIVSAAQPMDWQRSELGLQQDDSTSPSSSTSAQASTSTSLSQDATPQTTPDSLRCESRSFAGNHTSDKAPVVLKVACPQPYTPANAHSILFPPASPKLPDNSIETASDSNASVLSPNKQPKKARLRSNTCVPTKTHEETETTNRTQHKRRNSTLPHTSSSGSQTVSKPVPTRSNSIPSSSNHPTRSLLLDPIPEYSAMDEQSAEFLSPLIKVRSQNVEQLKQDNINCSSSAKEEFDASSTKYATDTSKHEDQTSMLWGTERKDAPGTRLQDMAQEEDDDDEILLDFARPSVHDHPDRRRPMVEENSNVDSLSTQASVNLPDTASLGSVPFGIFSERRIVASPTKSLTLPHMSRDDNGNIVDYSDYGDLRHFASSPNVNTDSFHRSIPPREIQAVGVSLKTQSFMTWNDINASALFPREIRRKVEEIIQQPQATPWADVGTMAPRLYQPVMDALQAILDYSPHLQRGFRREAAIKSLQAISRVSECLPSEMELQNVQRVSDIVTGGGFSDIFLGTYRSQKVCLKVLRLYTSDSHTTAKAFRQEALLWRQLDHPRILPLLGIDTGMSPHFCMVSPWMEHNNVNRFLESNPKHNRLKMVLEIIEGIEYLHTHNPPMVHADVRGANILVRNDLTCCLADFGLTMVIETRQPTESRLGKGTSHWMPPEVWSNASDTCLPARDVYSFGCTIIEIYSGKPPFPHLKRSLHILYEVVNFRRKPPRPAEITDTALWNIVDDCLAFEPMARPAASKVRELLEALVSAIQI